MSEEKSMTNTSIRMKEKSDSKIVLPKGAKILKKTHEISVQEIENGYLIEKETSVEYSTPPSSYTDYKRFTKRWYSKECPIEVETKDKELADLFE